MASQKLCSSCNSSKRLPPNSSPCHVYLTQRPLAVPSAVDDTLQISNVGFYDVSDDVVLSAFAADTLFIHGSSKSGGRVWNIGETGDGTELSVSAEGCNTACLTRSKHAPFSDVSTVCDATCLSNNPLYESRFRGYNCGVGNPSKYGEGCRRCYMNRSEALVADESMATADTSTSQPDIHVVMCNTLKPPEAMTCSKPCDDDQDSVSYTHVDSDILLTQEKRSRRVCPNERVRRRDEKRARTTEKVSAYA